MHTLPQRVFERFAYRRHHVTVLGTTFLTPPHLTLAAIHGINPEKVRMSFEDYGDGHGSLRLLRHAPSLETATISLAVLEALTIGTLKHLEGGQCTISALSLPCNIQHLAEMKAWQVLYGELATLFTEESHVAHQGTTVSLPMDATIYLQSAPGKAPFAEKGDHVERGQVLCVLEAMKTFSELHAPVSGIFQGFLLPNNSTASNGDVLCYLL